MKEKISFFTKLFLGEVYRGKLIEAEDNMNCQVPKLKEKHLRLK